jgi:hypothetical protein
MALEAALFRLAIDFSFRSINYSKQCLWLPVKIIARLNLRRAIIKHQTNKKPWKVTQTNLQLTQT